MNESLYYEIHVTIDPDFDHIEELKEMGRSYGFRMAKLLMRKKEGPGDESQDDMFFTSRAKTMAFAVTKTSNFCEHLQNKGYTVRRYKIEDTVMDSKIADPLKLLKEKV